VPRVALCIARYGFPWWNGRQIFTATYFDQPGHHFHHQQPVGNGRRVAIRQLHAGFIEVLHQELTSAYTLAGRLPLVFHLGYLSWRSPYPGATDPILYGLIAVLPLLLEERVGERTLGDSFSDWSLPS
jgi:hypothetical protein